MMAHEQKPDFVFRRNGRVHLNRRGRQFNRLLAAEVCGSAVEMWRVLATHFIRRLPLHFSSRASQCAITFQLDSTTTFNIYKFDMVITIGLCVVRVSGYKYRGPGFDPRRYQIFWVVVGLERGPLNLVRSIEELLEWKK